MQIQWRAMSRASKEHGKHSQKIAISIAIILAHRGGVEGYHFKSPFLNSESAGFNKEDCWIVFPAVFKSQNGPCYLRLQFSVTRVVFEGLLPLDKAYLSISI